MRQMRRRAANARNFAWLWLYGHATHWKDRNVQLNERGRIELLQRCLAGLSLIIGVIMCCTRHGNAGSLLVGMLDEIFTGPLDAAQAWLPAWLPRAEPHQAFGAALVASSASLLVAIYEWPTDADHGAEADADVADARLIRLLRMHLFGHMLALTYWAGTGLLSLMSHPLTLGPYVSAYLAYNHFWLYRRNNAEYVKEQAAAVRARAGDGAARAPSGGGRAASACQ